MFRLRIITPDRTLFDENVDSLSLPTPEGEITVLPHHMPLLSIVVAGEARVRKEGTGAEEHFSVGGGFLEASQQEAMLLLRTAEHVSEIEEEKVHAAIAAAQERLKKLQETETHAADRHLAETQALLARNIARLNVVRRRRRHS